MYKLVKRGLAASLLAMAFASGQASATQPNAPNDPAVPLHIFSGLNGITNTDGAYPLQLAPGPNGTFYGVTDSGGKYGQGTIYQVFPWGDITTIASYPFQAHDNQHDAVPVTYDPKNGYLYGVTMVNGQYGYGTIYQVSPTGVFSVIHSFTANDGAYPVSSMIVGANGDLYGTTALGGSGYGVLYEASPTTGNVTVLHYFNGNPDGANAESPVLEDVAGNIYGTTSYIGAHNSGTLWEYSPSTNWFTLLHSFGATKADGLVPKGRLVFGPDGNIYGVTALGGLGSAGTIYSYNPVTSAYTVAYTFGSQLLDSSEPEEGLAMGPGNVLYGTGQIGGLSGYGSVFRFDPATGVLDNIHSFNGTDASLSRSGVVVGPDNNLYGTGFSGGNGYGTVWRVGPRAGYLSPNQVAINNSGNGSFTFSFYGSGFASNAVVEWNGMPVSTVWRIPYQLDATVSAASLQTKQSERITVFDPNLPNSSGALVMQVGYSRVQVASQISTTGSPAPGTVAVQVTVTNTGTANATGVSVNSATLSVGGMLLKPQSTAPVSIGTLTPGQTVNITEVYSYAGAAGVRGVEIVRGTANGAAFASASVLSVP
jgi:uncharacterized repeat protein (TIGR03803 family)